MATSVIPTYENGTSVFITLDSGKIEIPVFSLSEVPEDHCAKYARLASFKLFGKDFSGVPSWNRKYHDKLVARVNEMALRELALREILIPGMIIGSFYEDSGYNNELDERGRPREYTHNALYLGLRRNLPMLAEQVHATTIIRNAQEHLEAGMKPIEIYDARTR